MIGRLSLPVQAVSTVFIHSLMPLTRQQTANFTQLLWTSLWITRACLRKRVVGQGAQTIDHFSYSI
ncbi:hypothetical protein ACLUUI_11845 [Enterobacterales bacterium AW_CKDN230030176-1A_HGKHYDSX7]